ncbi:hypothetical protein [Streptomyces lunaelactis]|uniref:hypothetical protein n=1 Tax=Streptomyces lunaelactis TaxID=1535768 RepID=UPI00131F3074|nr:hypothetical protein [Streptomyces lunaelactis]NUK83115.1 hypothetical protein [Streptomyces lunaelactis]
MTAAVVFAIPRAVLAPAVTAPGSANMGAVQPGQTTSVQLGQVRVTNGGARNWTATVSASDFTTGGGTGGETISKDRLSYWSGPMVSKTGQGTWPPGQPTSANAQSLNVARVAFSYTGSMGNTSVIFQPTLVMSVPASAVVGTYTGTVTHSVA